MKKKLTLLFMVPLLLTSCGKSKNAIKVFSNGELLVDSTTYIDINEDNIIDMMKSEMSFILYQYSSTCSHCEKSSKNFEGYFKKYHTSIYRYEIKDYSSYMKLNQYDDYTFSLTIITPRVMVINKGLLVDEVNSSKLIEGSLFNSAINSFVNLDENIFNVQSKKAYDYLHNLYSDINDVIYNPSNGKGMDEYQLLYNKEDNDQKYILINETIAQSSLIEDINK